MPKERRYDDISGKVFGRLKALTFSHVKAHRTFWNTLCVCGISPSIQ